jgi:hypothetical protein
MAFDVSTLASYTKDNEKELIIATIFSAKTQELIKKEGNVLTDVASSIQINQLETDAAFQAGGGCGFSASGTTTVTRRKLTVGAIKVHEALCPKDLKSKYLQLLMKAGSQPQDFPFEQEYTSRKAAKIAKQLEIAIWQGDLSSGTANLNKFDGLIKIIDAAGFAVAVNATPGTGTVTCTTAATSLTGTGTSFSAVLNANSNIVGAKVYAVIAGVPTLLGTVASVTNDTAIVLNANAAANATNAVFSIVYTTATNFAAPILRTTGITTTNVIAEVNKIWAAIPADVKGNEDIRVLCGWDVYETYIQALINANLYAYSVDNNAQKSGEHTIPGTQYVLTAVHGLDSLNRLYALRMSNLFLGCELEGEEDKFELFWAKEADQMRFMAEWKTGVQVALPAEIVQYALV